MVDACCYTTCVAGIQLLDTLRYLARHHMCCVVVAKPLPTDILARYYSCVAICSDSNGFDGHHLCHRVYTVHMTADLKRGAHS